MSKQNNELRKITRSVENLQYFILGGLLIAQIVVGKSYVLGQGIYLVCNIIACWRAFTLNRPIADKVKEITFICVTTALLVLNFFGVFN